MEIRPAFDISKLNASQPLGGSSHSRTCTKPCNVSTPLTRSPEKDMVTIAFGKGKDVPERIFKSSTKGLKPGEIYDKCIEAGESVGKFLKGFPD